MSKVFWYAGVLVCTLMLAAVLHAELPSPRPAKPDSLTSSKRILIIGDSNTHNGHLTGEMARLLEAEHGYFGSGYRSIVPDVGNGQADTYQPYLRISNRGEWKSVHFIGGDASAVLSPDGTSLQSSDPAHVAQVDFVGSAIDIYYAARPKGGKLKIEVTGRPVVEVDTASETVEIRRHRVDGLPMQEHTLLVSPGGGGDITLCGVESYTVLPDAPEAALIHKWGRSYAATTHFVGLTPAVWESSLKLIKPDYVVIMLGTNDHMNFVISKPIMLNNLATLVERVRVAVPETRIMLVSTVPVSQGLSYSNRLRQRYLESLPDLAKALGCDFWDLAAACGGTNEAWIQRGHTRDKIHFNLEGAKAAAPEMLGAIDAFRKTEAPTPEKLITPDPSQSDRPKFASLSMWLSADGPRVLDSSGRVVRLDNTVNQSYMPISRRTPYARAMVPGMRPAWIDNAVNGKPAVRFDGKASALALPFDANAEGFAMVVRFRRPVGALFGASLALYKRYGPGPEGTALLIDPEAKELKGGFYINGKSTPPEQLEMPDNEFVLLSYEGGGAFAIIGANEHYKRYTKGPGDPETISHFNGDIAELITWSRLAPKDADQRARVEAYLADKYGIKLNASEQE